MSEIRATTADLGRDLGRDLAADLSVCEDGVALDGRNSELQALAAMWVKCIRGWPAAIRRAQAAEARAARLAAAVEETARAVEAELARGYALTHEPDAGVLWRRRWNDVLGRLEAAARS